GVSHKAWKYKLENKLLFDSFEFWHGPYGNVKVSSLRNDILKHLPEEVYIVNNAVQSEEHSLEAFIPFLQYFNRNIEIVPVLVTNMPYSAMDSIAAIFSYALIKAAKEKHLQWGKDYAVVISNDCVHYGDEDWGGNNFAWYGADSSGYKKATEHEFEIINNCLSGEVTPAKIQKFCDYTVETDDFRKYKWTWCGRYSIPFGLLAIYYLKQSLLTQEISGVFIDYATSIDHKTINLKDIGLGTTAKANIRHWVGYAAIGYR
ncbi:MAG: AmmeMemoRadiSam system protein B, partial [Bacteroidia bacterium]|nr:AmmeMemoRadiSam system protein B [Bacteroidia bacterium]